MSNMLNTREMQLLLGAIHLGFAVACGLCQRGALGAYLKQESCWSDTIEAIAQHALEAPFFADDDLALKDLLDRIEGLVATAAARGRLQ